MRKAVAVALVLIAGAAVILWFGNRLNSWVLGGLIGGLASLLLSIPISLTLFSYFARQHDEQGQYAQISHKRLLSRRTTLLPREIDAGYDDEYALVDGEISPIVEERYQSSTAGRNSGWLDEEFGLPVPPTRQLPPPSSSRRTTGNVPTRHLSTQYGMQQRKTTPPLYRTSDREEEYRTRRTTARRSANSAPSGNQQASFRSRFHSEALHTARLEAVRQYMEENDAYIEDSSNPSRSPSTRSRRGRELQTDHLLADSFSEDIQGPLVRRAPYMYEDDEIRPEMSRYREVPPVRRSSRSMRERKNEDRSQ